jgi:hypothetical protein
MAEDGNRVPLEWHTPVLEGGAVVGGLADIWESWNLEIFWDLIFKPI